MRYLKALFSGWLNRIGTVTTLASIGVYVGLAFSKNKDLELPRTIVMLVAFALFAFQSWRIWHKESLKAEIGRKLLTRLSTRCDSAIREWKKLDREYREAPRETYPPAVLQDPMSPVWVSSGWTVYPYRVGKLQETTNTLLSDLASVKVTVPQWDRAHVALDEVLHDLEKCQIAIDKLSEPRK